MLISKKCWELTKHASYSFYGFWYLSSNGAIATVILYDIDLLFQGQIFQKLIYQKELEQAQKWHGFYRFWSVPSICIIVKVVLWPWSTFSLFQVSRPRQPFVSRPQQLYVSRPQQPFFSHPAAVHLSTSNRTSYIAAVRLVHNPCHAPSSGGYLISPLVVHSSRLSCHQPHRRSQQVSN